MKANQSTGLKDKTEDFVHGELVRATRATAGRRTETARLRERL